MSHPISDEPLEILGGTIDVVELHVEERTATIRLPGGELLLVGLDVEHLPAGSNAVN